MAVTYVENHLGFKVPRLHTVHVRRDRYSHLELYAWCRAHCTGAFYIIPNWHERSGCQFEDDRDAVLFALRWA